MHATPLTFAQITDLLRYFHGPDTRLRPSYAGGPHVLGIFDRSKLVTWGTDTEDVLRHAGAWPDSSMFPEPEHAFVAIGPKVMQGSVQRGAMNSRTFARRTANALNRYTPNEKGY